MSDFDFILTGQRALTPADVEAIKSDEAELAQLKAELAETQRRNDEILEAASISLMAPDEAWAAQGYVNERMEAVCEALAGLRARLEERWNSLRTAAPDSAAA